VKRKQEDKSRQELEEAQEFVRKALTALSDKPVSESKVRAVAKKVSKTMAGVLEHA
jgi:hypothetical protein